ncbi:exonuclease subunit SbcD [Paraglaciecola chathamensis]|uniref:exonuclease subunit SbcD n=1 Tax=Paraglaciecola chathamensis TaxID=368405 RepID=UPI002708DB0D|nr:exonuclease subunit SbcD [Paraglaciecola chathamensis]MDO6558912.1 exonuclease subunit SbcD [Paraglaciecola chathamensis]
MNILHTSDWHLGQNFFTKSRKDEHQAFLDWLLNVIQAREIDAVIVAGDIFDTGTPPSYARQMYNQFVVELSKLTCTLVVLGGNHDSVSTLNESKQLLACLNTHVIANTSGDIDQQVIELNDEAGQVGAILCAIPFIRPRDVLQSRSGESSEEKKHALSDAIKAHYATIYQHALTRREKHKNSVNKHIPIIATGHLTALGVSQSESVREIYIGTLDGFAADGFPPADYIALGHIHRPQKVAKSEHIRYSGSPIPLSFDELKSQKQVVLVEFDKQGQRSITPLDIPLFQPMAMLKGDLDSIKAQLAHYPAAGDDTSDTASTADDVFGQAPSESQGDEKPTWLCIHVDVQDYLSDLQQSIQTLTEGRNVEVLQLRRTRTRASQGLNQINNETLAELTPFEVFEKRLELENFEGQEAQQRLTHIRQTFSEIVEEVRHKEAK